MSARKTDLTMPVPMEPDDGLSHKYGVVPDHSMPPITFHIVLELEEDAEWTGIDVLVLKKAFSFDDRTAAEHLQAVQADERPIIVFESTLEACEGKRDLVLERMAEYERFGLYSPIKLTIPGLDTP